MISPAEAKHAITVAIDRSVGQLRGMPGADLATLRTFRSDLHRCFHRGPRRGWRPDRGAAEGEISGEDVTVAIALFDDLKVTFLSRVMLAAWGQCPIAKSHSRVDPGE